MRMAEVAWLPWLIFSSQMRVVVVVVARRRRRRMSNESSGHAERFILACVRFVRPRRVAV
jgi:hypothetical protein